ncbi:unnamed protein product, partial [Iphiclides podalirius]
MSFDVDWDIEKYKDDHESEEQWELRKAFMERWKKDYSEDRLICLAKVFTNMEFMGCRYPTMLMQEVARLSKDVALEYRKAKKSKLQRTFVSASTAAEDRAKGVKRKGGMVFENLPKKSTKINFVPQGLIEAKESDSDSEVQIVKENYKNEIKVESVKQSSKPNNDCEYLKELSMLQCLDITKFHEGMFQTTFGKMVLLIRPWTNKFSNIQDSCTVCHLAAKGKYINNCFSFTLNGKLMAQATGTTKAEAKSIVETMVWNMLREKLVTVLIKEQWIAQGEHVSLSDVSGSKTSDASFGTPLENSVATKMMQMMGWKGGGLGADAQGIAEPIKPNLQMVKRAGLGSNTNDVHQFRRAAQDLMRRYIASDTFDLDLVFSSDFSKEERAVLHQCARKSGLVSKSYGERDKDRFLVVKKKMDPFSLVRAVVQKGGNTQKYQVFIPIGLDRPIRR